MIRPRRNRKSGTVRSMVRETAVSVNDLIYPLFLVDGKQIADPILSLPGQNRWSLDMLLPELESCVKLGINSFVLFPGLDDSLKDADASYSYNERNFYLKAISAIKKEFPDSCLISDVAMDPYSSDGHDGLVVDGKILNDETLPILAKMAIAQADAGIDIIGPSDMMDGRVEYIREELDAHGHEEVSIMSYTAKYASAFYGPFRDALDSAPKSGDKKSYQMDPGNKYEAIREAELDESEGADFLMVKPALCYLDIIHMLKKDFNIPIAAYNVSGEYAMLKAAAQNGWLDYNDSMQEMLLSIKRAGADVILTYAAKEFALLNK
ncbi:porphobilinogen synthase [Flavobacteriales bacterium]|nr:porphobilinogen synthase [Flavobacteriales bacterium]